MPFRVYVELRCIGFRVKVYGIRVLRLRYIGLGFKVKVYRFRA